MKVTILGAVVKKGHNKIKTPAGRTQYLPSREEYHDDEIMKLVGSKSPGVYGRQWTYAGDQGFKESNIHVKVEYDDGKTDTKVFAGRTGLNDMVKYLNEKDVKPA